MIATVDRSLLSEAEQDVLDSLRSLGSATLAGLCGDTGRHPGEVTRALEGLEALVLAETRTGGVWWPLGSTGERSAGGAPDPAGVGADSEEAPVTGADLAAQEEDVPHALTDLGAGDGDPGAPSDLAWREIPRKVRIAQIVVEQPGLTSTELALLLGCSTTRIGQLGQELGLRRITEQVELPPHEKWSGRRTAKTHRWYPAEQQGGVSMSTDPDPVAGALLAQPEAPVGSAPSSSSNEEPEPSPGGSTAQSVEPAAAGRVDLEPSPGGSASSAGTRSRQPEDGEAPSSPAADPVCPPPVPVEPASAASLPGVAREEDGSGEPVAVVEEPEPELVIRRPSPTHVNASLFDRLLNQSARIQKLEDEASAQCGRADDLEVDLQEVEASLGRLGVPEGALAWRLGWLEGRLGPRVER